MTKQGNDQLFVENVFENDILDIRQNSKYKWGLLKTHGNGFFTYEKDLPSTFSKSEGRSGRPNVPQWKKAEIREMNSKIRSTSMHLTPKLAKMLNIKMPTGDQSTFGCLTYVERLSIGQS